MKPKCKVGHDKMFQLDGSCLLCEVSSVKQRLDIVLELYGELTDAMKHVVANETPHDEHHCACVPLLRAKIAQMDIEIGLLKGEIGKLKEQEREHHVMLEGDYDESNV